MNFDFFLPITETIHEEHFQENQLGFDLTRQTEEQFNYAEICLIGVENSQFGVACESIRRSLYKLYKGKKMPELYDLGNIRVDEDFFWKREEFAKIIAEGLEREIVFCFLGGGQEFLFELQQAYAAAKKYINIGVVDSRFSMADNEEDETDRDNYLFRICSSNPSNLFNVVQLGYQHYLVDPQAVNLLREMNFESLRLGAIRDNIQTAEPLIRDLDLLGISTESIKQAETNGQPQCSPNGLYSEEIAQLCRYAGMSEKLSTIGFFDYDALYDTNGTCAQLLAQSIWCFLEGFAIRQNEIPTAKSNSFIKYTVHNNEMELDLCFLKSEKTGRWWIKMPENLALLQQQFYIPCMYEDYETALEGDIPERWLLGFQKLNATR